MTRRTIVQLVAPGTGGVRDYAERLQRCWHGSHLVAMDAAAARAQPLSDRLRQVPGEGVALLVHFSGYGYQRRGLCFWLLREIEQARSLLGGRLHVVTMFHELYAFGPPWRSAFWLCPAQVRIAARLARLSDRRWTNSEHHATWLRRQGDVEVWPVFSNVGEPVTLTPHGMRLPQLVVFGSMPTRGRALAHLPRIAATLRRLGIATVVEAGPGAPASPASPAHRFVGRLEACALGELLDGSAFALIDYPPRHLGKSSVFAAYLAHGNVVLNTAASGGNGDGLVVGRHYVDLQAALPAGPDLPRIAGEGWHWYQSHRLDVQAEALLAALRDS
jgi:hypothetical protein